VLLVLISSSRHAPDFGGRSHLTFEFGSVERNREGNDPRSPARIYMSIDDTKQWWTPGQGELWATFDRVRTTDRNSKMSVKYFKVHQH